MADQSTSPELTTPFTWLGDQVYTLYKELKNRFQAQGETENDAHNFAMDLMRELIRAGVVDRVNSKT